MDLFLLFSGATGTRIVLNKQSDLKLTGAEILDPTGLKVKDIDQLTEGLAGLEKADFDAAASRKAIQSDVDANEAAAAAALAAEKAALESAIAALQADVDGNEADADSAIAALQADGDQDEADAAAAIAAEIAGTDDTIAAL